MSSSTNSNAIPPELQAWATNVNRQVEELRRGFTQAQTETRTTRTTNVHVKPPRPDFFRGTRDQKADLWLFELEQYFSAVGMPSEHKVKFAASCLRDAAATWWRSRLISLDTGLTAESSSSASTDSYLLWHNFAEALLKQFKPLNSSKIARDKLHRLRQTGSVLTLISTFNTLVADVPNMAEDEKMDRFCRACKPSIQQRLEVEEPRDLFDMQAMAQRLDEIFWRFNQSRFHGSSHSAAPSHSTHSHAMELDAIELQDDQQLEDKDIDENITVNAIKRGTRQTNFKRHAFKPHRPNQRQPLRTNNSERQKCMEQGLCFKCKRQGHRIKECPLWGNLKDKAQ